MHLHISIRPFPAHNIQGFKPVCTFLDDDHVPKLYNFSVSITIPPVQSRVVDLPRGMHGFLDPAHLASYQVSEKSDAYSFGALLQYLYS